MKIQFSNPRIVRVSYLPDRDDKDYTKCLWAHFDFDVDNWMMNVQSDVGDYAYRWNIDADRTFLAFLSKLDSDYLLWKIGRKTEVDLKETKERIRICLCDMDFTEDEVEDAMEELDDKLEEMNCDSYDFVCYAVEQWNDEQDLDICDVWEYVARDYSHDTKMIVKIFDKYVRKAIADKLSEGWITDDSVSG